MKNMRAEDYLQFMMDFQGDIFYSRQKCLNHLFVSIGNGYVWENGCLVEDDAETRALLNRWQIITPVEIATPRPSCVEKNRIYVDMCSRKGFDVKKGFPKWGQLSKEYSYLYNYPDDIREDWLALVNECKQMLIDDGVEV